MSEPLIGAQAVIEGVMMRARREVSAMEGGVCGVHQAG
jgi:uncharacterized protein YqhQ